MAYQTKHLTPDVIKDLKLQAAASGDILILFKGISIMVAKTYVDSAIFGLNAMNRHGRQKRLSLARKEIRAFLPAAKKGTIKQEDLQTFANQIGIWLADKIRKKQAENYREGPGEPYIIP